MRHQRFKVKTYPKNIFLDLTLNRKIQILLDLIYQIESTWDVEAERLEYLRQFIEYFKWMNFFENESQLLRRVASYQLQPSEELSLRQLLDLAVPFERYLEISIKDDIIIPVREDDGIVQHREKLPLYFVLDHLRSAFNVGSLFRTAECLGVSHIFLVGYSPTPEDLGVRKTAMGTEVNVSWSSHNHIDVVYEKLKQMKVSIFALETTETAQSLMTWQAPSAVALVAGNERFGLSQKNLKSVDGVIEIPMLGQKNSLNVANALAITSFEVVRQWKR